MRFSASSNESVVVVSAGFSKRSEMSVFCSHHDRLHDLAGAGRSHGVWLSRRTAARRLRAFARRAVSRIFAAFSILHQAIVTAKTRRLECEPRLHEIPRYPLVLGDKWDF
jgi:hypothetical protein